MTGATSSRILPRTTSSTTMEYQAESPPRPLPPLPSRTWWRRFTAPSHVSPEAIRTMRSMGYDRATSRRALSRSGNDIQEALKFLERESGDKLRVDRYGSSDTSSTSYSSATSCSSEATHQPAYQPSKRGYEEETADDHTQFAPPIPHFHTEPVPVQTLPNVSKRRWFTSITPLVLPARSRRHASTGPSETHESLTSTPTDMFSAISPVSTIIHTPTTPTIDFSAPPPSSYKFGQQAPPSSFHFPQQPPPSSSTFNANRRRWPVHLSKAAQEPVAPESPGWVQVDHPRETKRGATPSHTRNASNSTNLSMAQRHSMHGGPISSWAAMQDSHEREAAAHYPYAQYSPAGMRCGGTFSPQAGFLAVPSALNQHPFASSMTQCNSTAHWETESSDAISDTGTFGIKAPREWDNQSEWSDDGDHEHEAYSDDDGVDVQAWRDNMIKSAAWAANRI